MSNASTPTPLSVASLDTNIKEQAFSLLRNRLNVLQCQQCIAAGLQCSFVQWSWHCQECTVLGRHRCTYTIYEEWAAQFSEIDATVRAALPDDDVADYLRKEELIRAHATLLFNELRPRSPFFLTVYTYTRILERVSNYTMLFALLFILTFFDASSVFIILIRQRLNNLPGY